MYIEKLIEKFGPPPLWTPDTQEETMNDIKKSNGVIEKYKKYFNNIVTKNPICNCPIHCGDALFQMEAEIATNGLPIIVMQDKYGYHVSVGCYDYDYCPPAVDEAELEAIIARAIEL